MTSGTNITEEVRRIQREHYHDGDGGYAAVGAIRSFWHELEPQSQESLKLELTKFVESREPTIWALAWEALVQEQAVDVGAEILCALQVHALDVEWSDEIVLGLLRLGYRAGSDYCRKYVGERLGVAGPLALPLVAALVRVSPEDGIELASAYLVESTREHLDERVNKYAPSFVRHYLAVDEGLLRRLISELMRRDEARAASFAVVLNEYLAKPWMVEELGDDRSAKIRAGLTGAVHLSNEGGESSQ